jgi:Mat/Ecp fimbriae major subunit
MKKILAIAVLLTAFAASDSFAQTATAAVNLTVNSAITLTKTRDMNFGTIVQGITSQSIDPVTGAGATATFTLLGNAATPITVTFSSANLINGANTVTFVGTLAGNTVNTQSGATSITSGNSVTTSGSGNYYFWAGGSATLASNQAAGAYSGSFTLTVAY